MVPSGMGRKPDGERRQVAAERKPQDRVRHTAGRKAGGTESPQRAQKDQAVDLVDVKRDPRCNVDPKAGGPIKIDE